MRHRGRLGGLAATVALALPTAGCSAGPERSTVEVDATVEICSDGERCVSLPARGAAVELLDVRGEVVDTGVLGGDGTASFSVTPGEYAVRVGLADLGLEERTSPSHVAAGGALSFGMSLGTVP